MVEMDYSSSSSIYHLYNEHFTCIVQQNLIKFLYT